MAWRSQADGDYVPKALEDLAQPHIDSFDYFLGDGLDHVVELMQGVEVCNLSHFPRTVNCLMLHPSPRAPLINYLNAD